VRESSDGTEKRPERHAGQLRGEHARIGAATLFERNDDSDERKPAKLQRTRTESL
jgi:hypothetical protein